MCPSCSITSTARRQDRARAARLREFLDWLLTGRTREQMGAMGARAWRKRVGWCWNIKPAITPDGVVHHTLMADGTYMAHGWCLLIAIDGQTGQVIDRQWCHQENTAACTALFSRIPGPDVLITDGLRGVQKACHACWPGTRIQRCLVHVQRNTKTDLTLKPRLQAGKELKRLSDQLTRVHAIEEAVRWGEALNAWHERWKTLIEPSSTNAPWPRTTQPTPKPATNRTTQPTPKPATNPGGGPTRNSAAATAGSNTSSKTGSSSPSWNPNSPPAGQWNAPPTGWMERTTNRLEGGVNSPIKRTLLQHHGLPESHMGRACEWHCYMKTDNPDPASLIRDEHHQPQPAPKRETRQEQDEPEHYGTAINWNEFHTPVRYPNTTL